MFQVHAGDLGLTPNSKQQMFNQLSRQRVPAGEGRGGTLATDDKKLPNVQKVEKVDRWMMGGWNKRIDGEIIFHIVYEI